MKLLTAFLTLIILSFPYSNAAVSLESKDNTMVKKTISDISQRHKIPKAWLESQFVKLKLNESVLNLMQKPFEGKPWPHYKSMMVSEKRIANGKKFIKEHSDVLAKYEKRHRVPASVVTSIIGIETSYGQNKGNFHVLEALSTLAFYYTPRSQFFHGEMVSLLRYAYANNIDLQSIKSSYAGAVGIPQFMPSNIEKYGVHHGSQGKVNLYSDTNDAIASVFNYLKVNGKWQPDQPVMRKLSLPDDKRAALKSMLADTRMLPVDSKIRQYLNLKKEPKSWIIKLQRVDGDFDYYRVFHNFKAIMSYNNSVHYSSAVYDLSQKFDTKVAGKKGKKLSSTAAKKHIQPQPKIHISLDKNKARPRAKPKRYWSGRAI